MRGARPRASPYSPLRPYTPLQEPACARRSATRVPTSSSSWQSRRTAATSAGAPQYTRACACTWTRACTWACAFTFTCACTRACVHMHVHARVYLRSHAHEHVHVHVHCMRVLPRAGASAATRGVAPRGPSASCAAFWRRRSACSRRRRATRSAARSLTRVCTLPLAFTSAYTGAKARLYCVASPYGLPHANHQTRRKLIIQGPDHSSVT